MESVVSPAPPKRRIPGLPNPVVEAEQQKWLFTDEELERTPSRIDKIEREKEDYIRHRAIDFIWQVSLMLKLPPQTSMTATVYMHRFLMRYSLMGQYPEAGSDLIHPKVIAAVALFVAFKVDETMRRMKDFVIACCRVAMKNPNLIVDEQSKDYWRWRDLILQNESVMLEFLCFDLQLESPYRALWDYTLFFGVQENRTLRNASYAFLNDSTYTVVCLQFSPRVLAAAALYAAARHCHVAFPDDSEGRPWWEQIDVRLDDLIRACKLIVKIYERVQQNLSKGYPDFALSDTTPNDPTRIFDRDPTKSETEQADPTRSLSVTAPDSAQNGRKRSREPESHPSSSHALEPAQNPSSTLNGHGERSPKRQRTVTPSLEGSQPTPSQSQLPTSRPRIPAAALPQSQSQSQLHSLPIAPPHQNSSAQADLPQKPTTEENSAEEGEVFDENEKNKFDASQNPPLVTADSIDQDRANPEKGKDGPGDDARSEEGEI
jgi:protein BUR2